MYKINFKNTRVGIVIVIFSTLITLIFSGIIMYFIGISKPNLGINSPLYYLGQEEVKNLVKGEELILNNPEQIIGVDLFNEIIFEEEIKSLIPLVAVFFITVVVLSILLWLAIRKIMSSQVKEIAGRIEDIEEENDEVLVNSLLNSAYGEMKEKFKDSLDNYKRLNSYLAHEQKNEIAILRADLENSNSVEYIDLLDNITDSIDDILTLSETKVSKLEPVDVILVCAKLCDKYEKIQENIYFDFSEEESIVYGKERWIQSAVSNLIDNSIKYGEGKDINISVEVKNYSVIIKIQDHGIGIDKSKQDLIFNNRYRIKELKKDGYGIGLSLVSHVCDLCNGFITLDSEKGIGTTFYLAFPLM